MEKKREPFYNRIEQTVIIVLFTIMVVITASNVFTRYFFRYTPSWAEQATRIMFVWVTFAGVSWAGRIDAHMRVSAITVLTGNKIGRYVFWFGNLIAVLFGFYISWKIYAVMMTTVRHGQVFSAIPWCPVWVMYLAGVLGSCGFSLRVLQRTVLEIREQRAPQLGEEAEK